MLSIKVLGPGCPNCKHVEQLARKALDQLNVEATIEKVTDPAEIIDMGVMATPGLVIDDRVACKGRIPSLEEIVGYINQAAAQD
jgi:small redox-active disulfide protein 2